MDQPLVAPIAVVLAILTVGCFILQRIYRKNLIKERYFYMRDLTLVGTWMIFALWTGDKNIKFMVAMSLAASVIGMGQHVYPKKSLTWMYGAIAVIFAFLGPKIEFIGLPGGEYFYMSNLQSICFTSLWITIFPLLFQRLDTVPGLAGHLLGVSFSLMLLVASLSGQVLGAAFIMSLAGLLFTAVFWSRLGHNYRKLGEPLAAMWGILVAGTSLLGVSKGITFTTLMVIPLGLYAIPLAEASLHFVGQAIPLGKWGHLSLYHRMIDRGIDHPMAVKFVTFLCLTIGALISFGQLGINESNRSVLISILAVSVLVEGYCLRGSRRRDSAKLWGVSIDGISMNYALSRVRSHIINMEKSAMVITPNAISVYRAKKDSLYRSVARKALLTLPDGTGLVWGLKFLKMPVIERVTGIDFMQRICRLASVEGWPVYLLGSRQEIVTLASEKLEDKYPGLDIAGYHNGYFKEDETEKIINDIRESGARILFVALGFPRQELWLDSNLPHLDNVIGVGVGGSFDVISGKLKRAPFLWQKLGFEWLYRLIQEPWRLRQDVDLILFVVFIFLEKLGFTSREENNEEHSS